jgi:hypothetical protein
LKKGENKVSNRKPKVTFDTNCIIDIEQRGIPYLDLLTLVQLHNDQKINLRVVAISASERMPGGLYALNFAEFQRKIAAAGLENAEILPAIGYFDITFFDRCVAANDEMVNFERRLHEILFPQIEFYYGDFCKARGIDPNITPANSKWRNAKCDVLALWSHITYDGDIFVTSDNNFLKQTKKPALIALGAGDILTPQDAVIKLSSLPFTSKP